MPRPIRLGAVSYLNVRPLVYGLGDAEAARGTRSDAPGTEPDAQNTKHGARSPGFTLRFDVPSVCADLLAGGEIDLGMVPSITYLDRPGDCVVPGVCIGSHGAVASVAIFTRRPIREVRTIALDTSSRTSAALTRILCARRFEIAPTFVRHAPDLGSMLAAADAALLIGDPALFVDHHALGVEKIDLGAAWTDMTGLPFVWAFWSGRAGAIDAAGVRALHAACAAGVRVSDALADAYCAGDPSRRGLARRYLRDHIRFDLDARAIEGLRAYYGEALALGLVSRSGPVDLFGARDEAPGSGAAQFC